MKFASTFLFAALAAAGADTYFEPNRGQAWVPSPFLARTPAGMVAAGPSKIAFLRKDGATAAVELAGASAQAMPVPELPLPGVSHYILHPDPAHWIWDVPRYAAVRYRRVYPDIDLLYRTSHGGVEFDFLLAPQADPSAIRLRVPADARIDRSGALVLAGTVLHAPLAWQEVAGQRVPVDARFLPGPRHSVRLTLGAYNRNLPLTIDPVIEFATFLGGSGGDAGVRVLAGADGAIYIAGNTTSADFPASLSSDSLLNRPNILLAQTAFLSRLKPDGSALDWSLFIGGPASQAAVDLKQDSFGNLYLLGLTTSPNFPVTPGAWRTAIDPTESDLFLVKLDAPSGRVKAGTFLGLPSNANLRATLAIDAAGGIYIGGASQNLGGFTPTSGALQTTGPAMGFVLRLNTTLTAAVYATYWNLGDISSMDVDSAGGLWIAGNTRTGVQSGKPPFAALHPLPGINQTPLWPDQAYIAHLNPQGSALMSASLIHGDGRESGIADLRMSADGSFYLAGWTAGTKFPQANPLSLDTYPVPSQPPQDDYTGSPFLARISADGQRILQATLFSGAPYTQQPGQILIPNFRLAMQSNGCPCLAGLTMPVDFQTPGALVGSPANAPSGSTVGWSLSCEDAAGARFAIRTALPYTGWGYSDLAIAPDGDVLFTGSASGTFATTAGVFQPGYGGNPIGSFSSGDAFLLRIALRNPAPAIRQVSPASFILDSGVSGTCSAVLIGTGFAYGAAVTLNGQPAAGAFTDSSHVAVSFNCAALQPGDNHIVMTVPPPGGGLSDAILTALNAPPSTISLSPASVTQGAAETKLIIRAPNLTSTSVLNWNGAVRAASFVLDGSQTRTGHFELLLEPPELAELSNRPVTVTNPGPGGGTSPAAFFTVQPAAGSGALSINTHTPFLFGATQPLGPSISFTGSGFNSATQAFWDGAAVPVTAAAPGTISIQPPAADLERWGAHDLYVTNGAYRSPSTRVFVGRSLLAVGSAYDPALNRLYALVTSLPNGGTYCQGCDLQILDGATGITLATVPNIVKMFRAAALSADGRFLYIAQAGSTALATIVRYNTSTGAIDLRWPVPAPAGQAASAVNSLATPPDSPETLIVSTTAGQVLVFDHDRPRLFDSVAAGFPGSAFSGGFPIAFAGAGRIYGGATANCWTWLDYDAFGISGGQPSCSNEPPEVQHDSGIAYLTDGKRVYVNALPSLLTPANPYYGGPAYALDLSRRQAWEFNFASSAQLLQYAMDAQQLQLKAQLGSPGAAAIYPAGNGALLAVMPSYMLLIP